MQLGFQSGFDIGDNHFPACARSFFTDPTYRLVKSDRATVTRWDDREYLNVARTSIRSRQDAFDDARCAKDGTWFYRDIINDAIHRFSFQDKVVALHENP